MDTIKTPRVALIINKRNRAHYVMLAPVVIYLLTFVYWPIIRGAVMSFQDFTFINDSAFIGITHYRAMFRDRDFWNALGNSLTFAFFNVILGVFLSCLLAIMLNEIAGKFFRNFTQTIIYIPNLFSWVVVGSAFLMLLSPSTGSFNYLLVFFGIEPIYFFGKANYSKFLIIFINQWKVCGSGVIIYMAAIVGISHEQFEAAQIDGANRLQKILHVTAPNLSNAVKVMTMLNIMGMLMLFDPIYVLQNPITLRANDVLTTYIYRTGINKLNLGYGAAVSMAICVLTLAITLTAKRLIRYGLED